MRRESLYDAITSALKTPRNLSRSSCYSWTELSQKASGKVKKGKKPTNASLSYSRQSLTDRNWKPFESSLLSLGIKWRDRRHQGCYCQESQGNWWQIVMWKTWKQPHPNGSTTCHDESKILSDINIGHFGLAFEILYLFHFTNTPLSWHDGTSLANQICCWW